MTIAAGTRVRITAPGLYCGAVGIVTRCTIVSRKCLVMLDLEVWTGRHGLAVYDDDELEAAGSERDEEETR